MRTCASITRWLAATCLACALACAGCAPLRPEAAAYGLDEPVRLSAGTAAPFDGWLLSDADLEWLLKAAERGGETLNSP